jgi:hypothetical protein
MGIVRKGLKQRLKIGPGVELPDDLEGCRIGQKGFLAKIIMENEAVVFQQDQ